MYLTAGRGPSALKLNQMKRVFFFLISIIFLSCLSVISQSLEDVVYLKNGGIMHGIIIEQVPNQSLKIQTHDKNVFVYKFDEIEKITKEATSQSLEHDAAYLNPGLSWALSVVVPGAGQFYNGQYTKSVFLFLTSSSCFVLGYHEMLSGIHEPAFIAYTVIWAFSMIDAPVTAIKINKAHNLTYRFNPTVLNLAMDNRPYPGLNFSVTF